MKTNEDITTATELDERGVPDRHVDVFQDRAPKTVISKFNGGKELERLERINGKFIWI